MMMIWGNAEKVIITHANNTTLINSVELNNKKMFITHVQGSWTGTAQNNFCWDYILYPIKIKIAQLRII